MRPTKVLALGLLAISCSLSAHAQPNPHVCAVRQHGSVCGTLGFNGVAVGFTTDSQAARILGRGVVRPKEGDSGGRYYIDLRSAATLHLVSFTDGIVGYVSISSGVDPRIQIHERKAAESRWFRPDMGFGNWRALRLGSSRAEVLKNLGAPEQGVGTDKWRYSGGCTCELGEYLVYSFRGDRVVEVEFSAPSG